MTGIEIPIERLKAEVQCNLQRDCPEFSGGVEVELTNTTTRVYSTICEFVVKNDSTRRQFLVKISHRADQLPQPVVPLRDADPHCVYLPTPDGIGFEHNALVAIHDYFESIKDARFSSLTTRGTVLDDYGFVMDKVEGDSFSKLLRQSSFGRDRFGALEKTAETAGAWLRKLHQMPALPQTQTNHRGLSTTQLELASTFAFLRAQPQAPKKEIDRIESHLQRVIATLDDAMIDIRLNHHDFAPRNILVSPDHRITVIDSTLDECRPVFEDVADFLVDLSTNKLQLVSLGMAFSKTAVRRIEAAFLTGYFSGSPIPWKYVRFYQARQLLISWAALLWEKSNCQKSSTAARLMNAARIRAIRSSLKSIVESLPTATSDDVEGDVEHWIVRKLESFAENYIGTSVETVTVAKVTGHKFSSIMECKLKTADGQHSIIVKTARNPLYELAANETWVEQNDRPRLTVSMPPQQEIVLEASAMRSIHSHFISHADPSLKAIRVLDFLEDEFALVLEKIDDPTVDSFLKSTDLADRETTVVMNQIGRWLKVFHQISIEHANPRDTTPDDYRNNAAAYLEFLKHGIGHHRWLDQFRNRIFRIVEGGALDAMQIATNHGDFAAHNMFVGPQNQICGFDTLARWEKPIYEDLAYFQCVLHDHLSVQDSAIREKLNLAFLNGYFVNEPVPRIPIRLFQILIYLDKWSSFVFSCSNAKGFTKLAKKLRLVRRNRKMKKRLESCLQQIEHDFQMTEPNVDVGSVDGGVACKS